MNWPANEWSEAADRLSARVEAPQMPRVAVVFAEGDFSFGVEAAKFAERVATLGALAICFDARFFNKPDAHELGELEEELRTSFPEEHPSKQLWIAVPDRVTGLDTSTRAIELAQVHNRPVVVIPADPSQDRLQRLVAGLEYAV